MNLSRRATSGFTLIEVLVTLALMSLIGTILIESLRVGAHTWRRTIREAANVDEIARAQSFLRERLGTIHPPDAIAMGGLPRQSFAGESDSLEFSSTAPGHPDDGLARYRLELSTSEPSDLEIHYQHDPSGSSTVLTSGWARERLVARASNLAIQFWEQPPNSPGHWVDHWGDPVNLPALIRIDIRFADDDTRRWPPLYVEPRIDTRATCVFDIVSRRCRSSL
jgi:general secretion pathway protein J